MKAQLCKFRRRNKPGFSAHVGDWEPGVAFLTSFDDQSVDFIVDSDGLKLSYGEVHDFCVISGERCHIDSDRDRLFTHGDITR